MGHPRVFSVGDVEDPAGDESVSGFTPGVGGVDVAADGERRLVQSCHHDAVVRVGGEYDPQAVLICCQFEVRLGVLKQIRAVVKESVVDAQRV